MCHAGCAGRNTCARIGGMILKWITKQLECEAGADNKNVRSYIFMVGCFSLSLHEISSIQQVYIYIYIYRSFTTRRYAPVSVVTDRTALEKPLRRSWWTGSVGESLPDLEADSIRL
jgi:hypothetical protein